MTAYRHNAWQNLIGVPVQVRNNGRTVREGLVDDVMPDSSALWIAADGFSSRTLIEASGEYEVWVEPRQLEGKHAYRLTSSALHPGDGRPRSQDDTRPPHRYRTGTVSVENAS